MNLKKCFFCAKVCYCPYHVTEISDHIIETCDLCKKCGEQFIAAETPVPKKQEFDLTHIETPQQLVEFIENFMGVNSGIVQPSKPPCPRCGWTLKEFDDVGRFGCPQCYDHFEEEVRQHVFPYHGGNTHYGKKPKQFQEQPEEKRKLLKLRYAKYLELEEYEKAAEVKKELDALNVSAPSEKQQISSDQ